MRCGTTSRGQDVTGDPERENRAVNINVFRKNNK